MNWAVFKPSDSEIIPMAFGHGDLNDLRELNITHFPSINLYKNSLFVCQKLETLLILHKNI